MPTHSCVQGVTAAHLPAIAVRWQGRAQTRRRWRADHTRLWKAACGAPDRRHACALPPRWRKSGCGFVTRLRTAPWLLRLRHILRHILHTTILRHIASSAAVGGWRDRPYSGTLISLLKIDKYRSVGTACAR
eukprot:scaffold965_cov120-Isochrysis_galbana.AAC.12